MKKIILTSLVIGLTVFTSCGESKSKEPSFAEQMAAESEASEKEAAAGDMENRGIGPIGALKLTEPVDSKMAASGKNIFDEKCVACHMIEKKLIGPALKGVTERRNPSWIMNMILNPEEMVKEDNIAMRLMEEYKTPMLNQHLTEDEAREVLEYFRTI